jgi:tRNA G18 (ribose-2'-O)-methylase SpoU
LKQPPGPEQICLEGSFLIERALAASLQLESFYCVPAREAWARALLGDSLEPVILPEADISSIAGYAFHRGAFALAKRPKPRAAAEALGKEPGPCTILVLPEVGDPENLGAAFRNAAAFGCRALLLGPGGPDPLCRRVLRVSMGASLSLPWARLTGPEELESLAKGSEGGPGAGFETAACVLDPGARDLRGWKRPERLALVLGNEAFGLSAPWLAACGERLTLPMLGGADSLNVAAAAAVFLYALS